jgi:hypothetical protein
MARCEIGEDRHAGRGAGPGPLEMSSNSRNLWRHTARTVVTKLAEGRC